MPEGETAVAAATNGQAKVGEAEETAATTALAEGEAPATNGQAKAGEGETTTTTASAEGEAAATNGQAKAEELDEEKQAKIVKQVEYYFGDYNLPRDKFLQQEVRNCFLSLFLIVELKKVEESG